MMNNNVARMLAMIRNNKLNLMGYAALLYTTWLLVTDDDGQIIAWRALAVAVIVLLLAIDSLRKLRARHARRHSSSPERGGE